MTDSSEDHETAGSRWLHRQTARGVDVAQAQRDWSAVTAELRSLAGDTSSTGDERRAELLRRFNALAAILGFGRHPADGRYTTKNIPRPRRSDGEPVRCPQCGSWVAVITTTGPRSRYGRPNGHRIVNDDGGRPASVAHPARCSCGVTVLLDPRGQVTDIIDNS